MTKLSNAQARVLYEITYPSSNDEPFPPMNTLHALKRRGLIEVYHDRTDVFAIMTGALTIRPTDKGREALEEHEFEAIPQHEEMEA